MLLIVRNVKLLSEECNTFYRLEGSSRNYQTLKIKALGFSEMP
jgi:hypothetical protein